METSTTNRTSLSDVGGRVRGFWERREGTTGMVVVTLAAIGIFMGWGVIAPFVVATLLNTVYAGVLAVLLGGVFVLRKTLASMFQGGCRAITRIWANIDPIGIQEEDLKSDQRELLALDSNRDDLSGQINGFETEEEATQKSIDEAMGLVREARDKIQKEKLSSSEQEAMQRQLLLSGNEATRQREYLKSLQSLKATLIEIDQFAEKWRGQLDYLIKDRQSFINISKKQRRMSITGSNMVSRMKNILHVDPDRVYLVNAAIEAQGEQFNQRVGVIKNFARTYRDTLAKGDLKNEANAKMALRQLEEWERQQSAAVVQQLDGKSDTHPLAEGQAIVPDNKSRDQLFQ